MSQNGNLSLAVSVTANQCPIGETVGHDNIARATIPVLSCEGACIRGEIARQAANILARRPGFGRACHGELLTVPNSAIAKWVKTARQVVLIDGCFLRCHGRLLENLLGKEQLLQFDALSHYKRYSDLFDPEDVPEAERLEVARNVADWVADSMDGVAGSPTKSHGQSCGLPSGKDQGGCCGPATSCQSNTCGT